MKAYVQGWKEIDAIREEERQRQPPKTDTPSMLGAFNGMALAHIRRFPAEPTSGLIEMQSRFALARKNAKSAA